MTYSRVSIVETTNRCGSRIESEQKCHAHYCFGFSDMWNHLDYQMILSLHCLKANAERDQHPVKPIANPRPGFKSFRSGFFVRTGADLMHIVYLASIDSICWSPCSISHVFGRGNVKGSSASVILCGVRSMSDFPVSNRGRSYD